MFIEITYDSEQSASASNISPVYVFVSNDNATEGTRNLQTTASNRTGATIPKGSVVYISGAQGNRPSISLASATSEATSSKTYGLTVDDIANNSNGQIVTVGELINVNTSAFNDGDTLYLSTTPGQFTTTPPSEPNHSVYIGVVIRSHTNFGIIDLNIQNGFELNELHGVEVLSEQDNETLKYDSTTGIWYNRTILGNATAPLTSTSSGVDGDIRMDSSYLYVCIDTNSWKRVALSTW